MSERLSHTYTQMLIFGVLAYEMRDRPWWMFPATIVAAGALAVVTELIKEKMMKGE